MVVVGGGLLKCGRGEVCQGEVCLPAAPLTNLTDPLATVSVCFKPSTTLSQSAQQSNRRKKLKKYLFRAVSEGNVEELQRLLAEVKDRSHSCRNVSVQGAMAFIGTLHPPLGLAG